MPERLEKFELDVNDLKRLQKLQWVATEKIHGANFSFIVDANNVGFAKRTAILQWTDDFFGFQIPATQYISSVQAIYNQLFIQYQCVRCTIYGELFGGCYPHADVVADERVEAIQTGIYYAPSIEFCAFDIAIETLQDDEYIRTYLDYEQVIQLCQAHNLMYAKPLIIAPINDVFNFNTRIQSTIPAQLGLPALRIDNLIEGIVVKPYQQATIQTAKGILRPIVKIKNEEFKEEKFHEAQKWKFSSATSVNISLLIDEIANYINNNRLQAAISKVGKLNADAPLHVINEIKTLFFNDTLESFTEDFIEFVDVLTPIEYNALKSAIIDKINILIDAKLAS